MSKWVFAKLHFDTHSPCEIHFFKFYKSQKEFRLGSTPIGFDEPKAIKLPRSKKRKKESVQMNLVHPPDNIFRKINLSTSPHSNVVKSSSLCVCCSAGGSTLTFSGFIARLWLVQ
jgi:hypothetical protein